MAGVLVRLTSTAVDGVLTAMIAIVALGVLVRTKVNSAWLVGIGLLIGAVHAFVA
jgi:hypothetical protein